MSTETKPRRIRKDAQQRDDAEIVNRATAPDYAASAKIIDRFAAGAPLSDVSLLRLAAAVMRERAIALAPNA